MRLRRRCRWRRSARPAPVGTSGTVAAAAGGGATPPRGSARAARRLRTAVVSGSGRLSAHAVTALLPPRRRRRCRGVPTPGGSADAAAAAARGGMAAWVGARSHSPGPLWRRRCRRLCTHAVAALRLRWRCRRRRCGRPRHRAARPTPPRRPQVTARPTAWARASYYSRPAAAAAGAAVASRPTRWRPQGFRGAAVGAAASPRHRAARPTPPRRPQWWYGSPRGLARAATRLRVPPPPPSVPPSRLGPRGGGPRASAALPPAPLRAHGTGGARPMPPRRPQVRRCAAVWPTRGSARDGAAPASAAAAVLRSACHAWRARPRTAPPARWHAGRPPPGSSADAAARHGGAVLGAPRGLARE